MLILVSIWIGLLWLACGSLRRDLNGTKAKLDLLVESWDRWKRTNDERSETENAQIKEELERLRMQLHK